MATLIASVAKNGSGNSAAIDTTGADFLIAWCSSWVGAPTIVDSKSNTWTALTERTVNSYYGRFFYVLSPTVGTGHTFGNGGSFPGLVVSAWDGVTAYDSEGGATTTGATTLQPGSLTPGVNNALIFAGLSFEPASLTGIDSGFSVLDTAPNSSGVGASMAYLEQVTPAAVNPTWTVTASANLIAALAVFEAPPTITTGRVTQHPVEYLRVPDATPTRVTQSILEAIQVTRATARASQHVTEIVRRAFTPVRITQNVVEIIRVAAPFAPPDGCPAEIPIGTASDVQCAVDLPIGTAGSGACAPDWTP